MTDCVSAKVALANNIKFYRSNLKWSQAKLAEEVGVNSASTVGNWEAGLATPDYDKLCFLADIFEVSTDTLLGHEVKRTEQDSFDSEAIKNLEDPEILMMYYSCDEIGRAAIDNCVQFHYDRCSTIPSSVSKGKNRPAVKRETLFLVKGDEGYDDMCKQMSSLKKLRKNSGKEYMDITKYLWARGYNEMCLGYVLGVFDVGPFKRVPSQLLYDEIKAFLKGNYTIVPNVINV